MLRIGSCGGRTTETDPETSKAKASHGYSKQHSSRYKGVQKESAQIRQGKAGLSHQAPTAQRRVRVAGGYMLWLIAGNEQLVC